jgi:hypothetical protein
MRSTEASNKWLPLMNDEMQQHGEKFGLSQFLAHNSVATVQSTAILIKLCIFFSALFEIAFTTPNPDEATLNDVKRDLKQNGLDLNQFSRWETNHC